MKRENELVIDADGHILEPPDLWEKYIDPKYRDRTIRIRSGDDGWEFLEVDGHAAKYTPKGMLGRISCMGRKMQETNRLRQEWIGNGRQGPVPFVAVTPDETYIKGAGFGTTDPKERLARMDEEGLDKSVLYPTLGLTWEIETTDAELSAAYCRAYNRWIAEFCADSGGRLMPIAHISLGDPKAAAGELRRAVKAGCKGAFIAPLSITGKAHGHPDNDPVYAAAQDLDVPIGFHPTFEPAAWTFNRFDRIKGPAGLWFGVMFTNQSTIQAFTSLFAYGVFDKFPKLRVVVLESGAGWIGWWLDRADALFTGTLVGGGLPLAEKPSYYFRRQCFISGDPDEMVISRIADYVGADKFFWASDFPHPDHAGNYIEELEEMAEKLSPDARRKVLGDNVLKVYKCA
jgi:predicted TIM-barrel fold metal-dependent hydrolase